MLVARSCPTLCDPLDCNLPALLSVEFTRQEYWSGLPFSSLGHLPHPGIKPTSPVSPALAGRFCTIWAPREDGWSLYFASIHDVSFACRAPFLIFLLRSIITHVSRPVWNATFSTRPLLITSMDEPVPAWKLAALGVCSSSWVTTSTPHSCTPNLHNPHSWPSQSSHPQYNDTYHHSAFREQSCVVPGSEPSSQRSEPKTGGFTTVLYCFAHDT